MKKLLPSFSKLALAAVLLLGSYDSFSQGISPKKKYFLEKKAVPQAAVNHLRSNKLKLNLSDADLTELKLSDEALTRHSGMRHLYLQQAYQGIEIYGAVTNINISRDNQVVSMGNRFHRELSKKVKSTAPQLAAEAAVAAAAKHLNLSIKESLSVKERGHSQNKEVLFTTGGISLEPIPAKLVYQPMEDGSLVLAWEISIYELDALNWWNIRVDANTGKVLDKDNMVVHCQFDNNGANDIALHSSHSHTVEANTTAASSAAFSSNAYNVFALPSESPSHGPRIYVTTDAADKAASPYGWHTTQESKNPEFTITRGNNVHAYEDPDNNNNRYNNNYSPDGGSSLLFDYPVDFKKQPENYRDAAVANLFYTNNIMHDVWYQYGFDEASGNFQVNNYGRGGAGGDYVMAEAQDSRNITSTRNNANFSTPRDGSRPRMQMYLWSGSPDADMFRVTSPATIAGSYPTLEAAFGKPLSPTPVTGKLVLANEQAGCSAFSNADAIKGNIAVVYRGTCAFVDKVQFAEAAGAIAVVVVNNSPGAPITMGGTPTKEINISSVMISQEDGTVVRALLDEAKDVIVSLKNDGSSPEIDGDFDNGIIAHEYGHGISIRLTGGPNNVACLNNAEQGGEGWSDWFGLMITMQPGDKSEKARGIGTYAQGQSTTGQGIRPAPYSTSFAINSYTYGATNNTSLAAPHGVGFVWATMLWDLTWAMVDQYGFDKDVYYGKGGNNMAMQLVIDGLKLQPCSPGFVDARDAILAADVQNYGGANQELIWKVFANRGLGYSADQGSSASRTDQLEAFDLPPVYACNAPVITVKPTSNVFTGGDVNTIYLGYGAQSVQLEASGSNSYSWSPANGLSNTNVANPVFTPKAAGSYNLTVTATNTEDCSKSATVTITVIDVRCGKKNDKVLVCHNGKSNCISSSAVAAHLTHGDVLGDCNSSIATAGFSDLSDESVADGLLLTAYPNPAGSYTNLEFTMVQDGKFKLEIRDIRGAVVSVLTEDEGKAGESYSYTFDRGNLAGGIYIARLVTDHDIKFVKIVLDK
ncbi:T9SS-dependent M36 family metallopeptidase [Pontibacter silvestris]|uniref:T9SS-dependent M36 family metallopeptidase n=1 Tax=Pontibacter silvestris TaxID=2305183 RepID=A0ABW4X0I2_9BACT|nr:T9SS-dependent M36 family metallopeptidase [Pontibacter silvestris]MCC9136079.1 T9SS-dependent M36 family metallopeptidase [Pontibacter silvestris]